MKEDISREEYMLLVEKAPIMIWRSDITMECDYFNEVWLSFTGRSMEQEIGNGWAEGVHPDDFDRCLKIYTDHFARREIFEMEYRLRRFDGVYRWIFDRGVPYSDAGGNFKGYIGSCVDVTERIEAQEALKKTQEAEIRTLRGFLPICSYCKKIRNDRNYWEQIESYISNHSDVLFSHSICPDCGTRVMAEVETQEGKT
ncbi:MAG TPA: PAS domain S-box protein, partial [Thermodesulfovibrionales bacterium]|nr:PAS domain S-box protein [Thermodesulfovibrionales bacterium]